jgi:uncharacterized protein YkwD
MMLNWFKRSKEAPLKDFIRVGKMKASTRKPSAGPAPTKKHVVTNLAKAKIDENSKAYKDSVKWGLLVLKYTNEYRKKKGSSPATQIWNKRLHDLCYLHSIDMARVSSLSHDGFKYRIGEMRKKYPYRGGNENVA